MFLRGGKSLLLLSLALPHAYRGGPQQRAAGQAAYLPRYASLATGHAAHLAQSTPADRGTHDTDRTKGQHSRDTRRRRARSDCCHQRLRGTAQPRPRSTHHSTESDRTRSAWRPIHTRERASSADAAVQPLRRPHGGMPHHAATGAAAIATPIYGGVPHHAATGAPPAERHRGTNLAPSRAPLARREAL